MNEQKQPEGWERLTCLCGQSRFAPMIHLRWRNGAGITQEQAGYFCLECHGTVDAAQLIARAQVRSKQRELKELESEIQDITPAAAAPRQAVKKGG